MPQGSELRSAIRACYLPNMRKLLLLFLVTASSLAQGHAPAPARDQMDRDLMEITVEQLHTLYREHRYTVTQVVQWHLDRIARYNGIYRAVQTVNAESALAEAAREDTEVEAARIQPRSCSGVYPSSSRPTPASRA